MRNDLVYETRYNYCLQRLIVPDKAIKTIISTFEVPELTTDATVTFFCQCFFSLHCIRSYLSASLSTSLTLRVAVSPPHPVIKCSQVPQCRIRMYPPSMLMLLVHHSLFVLLPHLIGFSDA